MSTHDNGGSSEARIAKALAHPLRARILSRLGERVSSPGDLAAELGAPLGVVSYHVRMLRDYDCVELVRIEPRRGALQHFYKATARPNLDEAEWRTLPAGLRSQVNGQALQAIVDGFIAAEQRDVFPTGDVKRVDVELDERGRRRLQKATAKYLEQVAEIGATSSARELREGDEHARMVVAVVTYDQAS